MNVYELMEEIINEVSLRKWKEAAKNSIEGRKEEAAKSLEVTDKGWQKYEKEARKHPEDEPQLFKLAQANDAAAYKDKERAEHAAKVAYNAPDSKHSANKFLKAAHNAEEFQMDKADYRKPAHKDEHYKKAMYARHQASMDPVKSRTNEAFELMEEILNELNDDVKVKVGKIRADQAFDSMKQLRNNSIALRKAQNNTEREKIANEMSKNSDELDTKYKKAKKFNNLFNKNVKDVNKKRELKNYVTARGAADDKEYKEKIGEAFSLMEEILFELDLENKQSISPNKIKKTKKDENGEKVEVVSVADELFPYEGDAKQQFNQKILAKINDMIEGTGSLEDLIQFVRRGVGNKKVAHEGLDEAIGILEDIRDHVEKKRLEVAHADPREDREGYIKKVKDYEKLKNAYNDAHGRELEGAEVRASGGKDITFRGFKKVSQARHSTKNAEGEAKTRERRANSRQIKKAIFRHNTKDVGEPEVKAYSDPTLKYYNRLSGDRGHLGIKYHNKSDEDKIKASIERHAKKSAHEGLSEAITVLEDIYDAIRKSNKSAKEKSELTTKAMTTQGKELVDAAKREGKLATGIMVKRSLYNTKNANGERHTNTRRERIPFNDNCKLTAHESNISERKNIFGHEEGNRGDLIDDVSQTVTGKTLNQHIENKVVKPVKRVEEALELMEQILMETSYERKMELLRKREENADQANVNAFKDLIRGYVVGATPEEKAKAEQDFAKSQAKNLEAQGKLNKARRLVQNSGKKKVNEALDLMEEIIKETRTVYDTLHKSGIEAGESMKKLWNGKGTKEDVQKAENDINLRKAVNRQEKKQLKTLDKNTGEYHSLKQRVSDNEKFISHDKKELDDNRV